MLTSEHTAREIERKARKVMGMLKRGIKFTPTQPDVIAILALKTRGKYKKKYLKYAKNPEEVPNEKDFFRIFLCIERGYRSII